MEEFVLTLGWGGCETVVASSATTVGQVVVLELRFAAEVGCFAVPPGRYNSFVVSVPSQGNYCVEVRKVWPARTYTYSPGLCFDVGAAVAHPAPLYRNLGGLWWAPEEPGWALAVTQSESGGLFALWFTYVPDSVAVPFGTAEQTAATWYMLPSGYWTSPTAFSGQLYTAVGPPANLPFNPSSVAVNRVGTATIRALSADRLEFETEAANGVSKRKTLQRFTF